MKKAFLSLAVAAIFSLGFVACTPKTDEAATDETAVEVVEEQAPVEEVPVEEVPATEEAPVQ